MHKAKALSPSFVLFVTDLAVQQLEHIFQSEKQCMFICHYDMFYILWLKGRVTLVAFTRIEKKKKMNYVDILPPFLSWKASSK